MQVPKVDVVYTQPLQRRVYRLGSILGVTTEATAVGAGLSENKPKLGREEDVVPLPRLLQPKYKKPAVR